MNRVLMQSGAGMLHMFMGTVPAPSGPPYFSPGLSVHARRLVLLRRSTERLSQEPIRAPYWDRVLYDDDRELRATAAYLIGAGA